jgi:hypothetical protein
MMKIGGVWMKYKMGLTLLATLGILLATIAIVSAAEPGGATISGNSTRIGILAPTAGSQPVVSGNITAANLDSNQSTYRWAGLMGNVTGKIVLGDSSQAMLFNWTAKGNLVYASNSSSISWGSLADAVEADLTATQFAFLATSASVNDDYSDTFIGGSQSIGSTIFNLNSDYATTASAGASVWKTYSLKAGTAIVFAGKVVEDGTPYNNIGTTDFQMIIPEDGTSNNYVATSYYLWVELQ